MSIFDKKHIGILGLGNHGGGISTTRFVYSQSPQKISIIDSAPPERLNEMLKALSDIQTELAIVPYSVDSIKNCDVIIKNPAVHRKSEMLMHAKHIETDISLYFLYNNTPSLVVTGSKGKSSISTALTKLLQQNMRKHTALAGNITFSPLNLLLDKKTPDYLVLELSSFQIGDFELVDSPPYHCIDTMILTNIMRDHQNYYGDMTSYVADKLFLLKHSNEDTNNESEKKFTKQTSNEHIDKHTRKTAHTHLCPILPYDNDIFLYEYTTHDEDNTETQKITHEKNNAHTKNHSPDMSMTIHGNTITLTREHCYFHAHAPISSSTTKPAEASLTKKTIDLLPPALKGAWLDSSGLWVREKCYGIAEKIIDIKNLPLGLHPQNIAIIATAWLRYHKSFTLPNTSLEWEEIFTVPHRKEIVALIEGRTFVNDTSATIPEAIQLSLYGNIPIQLIAGGSDKNINIDDYIQAIKAAKKIYLLEGNFTKKLIPSLKQHNIHYAGPFDSLKKAFHQSYRDSHSGDHILLSPGCASFGMFLHEFDRGNQFKNLVLALQSHQSH